MTDFPLSAGQLCRIAGGLVVATEGNGGSLADQMADASEWATYFETGIAAIDEDEPTWTWIDETHVFTTDQMSPLARKLLDGWQASFTPTRPVKAGDPYRWDRAQRAEVTDGE